MRIFDTKWLVILLMLVFAGSSFGQSNLEKIVAKQQAEIAELKDAVESLKKTAITRKGDFRFVNNEDRGRVLFSIKDSSTFLLTLALSNFSYANTSDYRAGIYLLQKTKNRCQITTLSQISTFGASCDKDSGAVSVTGGGGNPKFRVSWIEL